MKTGKNRLTLAVIDVPAGTETALIALFDKAAAVEPVDDYWRRKARSIIEQADPGLRVYSGGRHIAIHLPGKEVGQFGGCLGRIVETKGGQGQ